MLLDVTVLQSMSECSMPLMCALLPPWCAARPAQLAGGAAGEEAMGRAIAGGPLFVIAPAVAGTAQGLENAWPRSPSSPPAAAAVTHSRRSWVVCARHGALRRAAGGPAASAAGRRAQPRDQAAGEPRRASSSCSGPCCAILLAAATAGRAGATPPQPPAPAASPTALFSFPHRSVRGSPAVERDG